MLVTRLHQGKSVMIGDAKVTILRVKGKGDGSVVHLGIDADKSIKVKYEREDNAPQLKQDA